MNTAKIVLLVWIGICTSPQSNAGDLPNALGDPISRPKVGGGGRGAHLIRFAFAGNLIYVADGPMGFVIYDVTDTSNPKQVGHYATQADASAVSVSGQHAWVYTSAGTVALDVSDPANPKRADPLSGFQGAAQPIKFSRLIDVVETVHPASHEAASDTQRALVAIVGDRAYISRDDGVVVLEMNCFRLPPLPLVASRRGADPVSTEAWLPGLSTVREADVQARAHFIPMATATAVFAPMTQNGGSAPVGQALSLAAPSVEPITITATMESGVFRLMVSGLPGQAVRVQRSSSPVGGWDDWQTITLGDDPMEITDDAGGADQIFYRAVTP